MGLRQAWLDPPAALRQSGRMTHLDAASALRDRARALFEAGVAAADPEAALHAALAARPLAPVTGRREIVAVGKAARAMARAALDVLGPAPALIVTNRENAAPLDGAQVFAAGHPVPDEDGARAAETVLARAAALVAGDELLVLVSGGGSALMPAAAPGLSLDDKAEVTRLLLKAGADITEMNLVRQQLSRIKGGGLARAAAPARVTALILSDVVGDDLRVIASGPTVAPIGTRAEARARLDARGLWDQVPQAVRAHLAGDEDPPLPPEADNRLIGSNAQSLAAMAQAAAGARRIDAPLIGDVAAAAGEVLDASGPGVTLFGGETTVNVTGPGRGGRNQELALRVALGAEARGIAGPWVFLSGGTDGRDGPTDAAGGLVDDTTLARMRAAGVDPEAMLARNDSYAALAASGDLLMTGATGTNVADLQVMIRPDA